MEDSQFPTSYMNMKGEDAMLSNYPIDVVLLAMDLAAAKVFYCCR